MSYASERDSETTLGFPAGSHYLKSKRPRVQFTDQKKPQQDPAAGDKAAARRAEHTCANNRAERIKLAMKEVFPECSKDADAWCTTP